MADFKYQGNILLRIRFWLKRYVPLRDRKKFLKAVMIKNMIICRRLCAFIRINLCVCVCVFRMSR